MEGWAGADIGDSCRGRVELLFTTVTEGSCATLALFFSRSLGQWLPGADAVAEGALRQQQRQK
ncbi:hypothetical protein KLO01_13630 [Knoellia locipacati]|uniref:Uncharacterized protein n=1 Tax=Knoellia locipacati TaxID=882824 RepID=A0A512SZD7_9MICO|nr:hypothetical protein KLO01_13630 [Knoellia locipacati]